MFWRNELEPDKNLDSLNVLTSVACVHLKNRVYCWFMSILFFSQKLLLHNLCIQNINNGICQNFYHWKNVWFSTLQFFNKLSWIWTLWSDLQLGCNWSREHRRCIQNKQIRLGYPLIALATIKHNSSLWILIIIGNGGCVFSSSFLSLQKLSECSELWIWHLRG